MSTDLSNISPALEASGLSIGYRCGRKEGWKTVHPRVNFVLHRGELTSLIGLNGAGKSTLLRTLCGFQPAVSGTVRVLGRELPEYSSHELALTVGVVLTERTNAGGLTVRELVALGRQPHTGFSGGWKSGTGRWCRRRCPRWVSRTRRTPTSRNFRTGSGRGR